MNVLGEFQSFEEVFLVDPMNAFKSKLEVIERLENYFFDDYNPHKEHYNTSQNEFSLVIA
jgi:hypothetical protein